MTENESSEASSEECVVVANPIPPEEIKRYSPIRDPDLEADIAGYVEGQARDETVQHVEKVKTEYIVGDKYEVWDVTTDKDRWWVITNMTNLYSQRHFPSLDYTLSFHVGLMMRLRSRPEGPDAENPPPFDEVIRRIEQAQEHYERAIEGEDFQAVGMLLREALISLINAVRRSVELAKGIERPKDADFIGWSKALFDQFCPGASNKELRRFLKSSAEKTWQLVNWLTHTRSADRYATAIAVGATEAVVGQFFDATRRSTHAETSLCPICSSRNVRDHYDIDISPDGNHYQTCGKCGWSNHPERLA